MSDLARAPMPRAVGLASSFERLVEASRDVATDEWCRTPTGGWNSGDSGTYGVWFADKRRDLRRPAAA